MIKNLLFGLIWGCFPLVVSAQIEIIAQSEYFKEPTWGHLKIVSMKNGETALVRFDLAGDIHLTMYDSKHKLKLYKELKLKEKFFYKHGKMLGIFESASDIVVYFSNEVLGRRSLTRIIINTNEGTVKSQQLVGKLKSAQGRYYSLDFGGVSNPEFFLSKDVNSENYAIIFFNTLVSDRNERIEVIHFDSLHNEISRAFCQSPEGKYKFIEFLDAVVIGDKEVIIAIQGASHSNPERSKDPASIYLGKLAAGAKQFEFQDLDYLYAKHIIHSTLKYNFYTEDLLLLTIEYNKRPNPIPYFGSLIVSDKHSKVQFFELNSDDATQVTSGLYKYDGRNKFILPHNLIANSDSTLTILFESIRNISSSRYPIQSLVDIGIVKYDKKFNKLSNLYIPKSHTTNLDINYMYHTHSLNSGVGLTKGGLYKYFQYINTGKNEYVFMNDLGRNQEAIDKGKEISNIYKVGEAEAFVLELTGNQIIPRRKQLFNLQEGDKKLKTLAQFQGTIYNPETKILTTMTTSTNKKKEQSRLVWMKIE